MLRIFCRILSIPHNIVMDLRATSHTSQEPWPCNGEDPWLSSKGRTMGVGKVVLGSHGPSSIFWSENEPLYGTIAYFVRRKEGRIWFNIIFSNSTNLRELLGGVSCLKSVLESIMDYILESTLKFVLKYVMLKNILKKHGIPKFASGPPLGGRPHENFGRPWNLIHSLACRTPCRFFIHEVCFGPLSLHLRVQSQLGRSPPFRPMRAFRLQWSWAFSLVR